MNQELGNSTSNEQNGIDYDTIATNLYWLGIMGLIGWISLIMYIHRVCVRKRQARRAQSMTENIMDVETAGYDMIAYDIVWTIGSL